MKKRGQIKLGIILSYVSLGLGNVISILYTPIMLRLLGQSEYGLYNLSNSIIGYLGILDFGIGNAVIRYTSKYKALEDKEGESNLYGMFIIIYSLLGFLVILAGFALIKNTEMFFSNSLTLGEVNRIQCIMLLMMFNLAISFPFGVFDAIIIAHENFVFPKILTIIRQLINPFIMLPLLLLGYKSLGMTVATTFLNIIFISVNVYYCFKVLKIKIKFKNIDFSALRDILGYSFFIFLNMIVDKIYWATDQFILGAVRGTVSVAIYSIGSMFNQYYMNFSTAISGVFLPRITKMVTKNASTIELSNLFIKTGRIQFIILSFILSSFLLIGKEFIAIWAGPEYENSYMITLFIMFPLTIPLIQTLGITILQAKNMHKFRSIVYLIIAIFNVILSIPLAKMYGGIGCAVATGFSMIIGHIIIMNYYYYKYVDINIPKFWIEIFKLSLPICMSVLITLIVTQQLHLSGVFEALMREFLFITLFVLLTWTFGMNEFEKSLVRNPIRNIKQRVQTTLG